MKKGWSTANHPFCRIDSDVLPLAEHRLNTLSKSRKDHTVKDIIQPSEKQAANDDSNNHRYRRINVAFSALIFKNGFCFYEKLFHQTAYLLFFVCSRRNFNQIISTTSFFVDIKKG